MLQYVDGKLCDTVSLRHAEMCRRLMPDGRGGWRQIMLPRLRRRRCLADALALSHRAAPSLVQRARGAVTYATPRPRRRAQCGSPRGRDGNEARNDGGGGGDDDGGGSDPPPQRLFTLAPCDRDCEPLAGGAS